MIQTLRNAWRVEDIRKKLIFTLIVLALYRIGNAVPVPFVDVANLQAYFDTLRGTIFGLLDVMSGGAFSSATIFALSIQPYINSSIIIQLLCIAIPALERMSKDEGEEGKKKIASITRYTTVAIALLQGFGYYVLIKRYGILTDVASGSISQIAATAGVGFWQAWFSAEGQRVVLTAIVIIFSFTSGSALIMWMGEQITEKGIGNGISMILFASIVSRFPNAIGTSVSNLQQGTLHWGWLVGMLIGALAIVVLIVLVNDAERRIPIQYSKRVVGNKMYGGQNTFLPMKVNMSGVMPIIFAQSIASIPATIAAFTGKTDGWVATYFGNNSVLYAVVYGLLIVFFAYFYSTIQMNPIEMSNNLKRSGGQIPGIRSGRPTSDYISKVLGKITLFGALFLCIIAVVPILVSAFSKQASLTGISLGGTSIIIVVGVALEIFRALENELLMRNYSTRAAKGFLK